MNPIWHDIISKKLNDLDEKDLKRNFYLIEENRGREILYGGKKLLNFASNNYLGLSLDERLIEQGIQMAKKWGAGSAASRLMTGTYKAISELEEKIALWLKKSANHSNVEQKKALIFNSGYQANLAILSTLADRDTVIFSDKLNHASIYDGMRLSGAKVVRYNHNDLDSLKKRLASYKDKKKKIIITESLFSMQGDIAPLEEMAHLAQEAQALFIVDEAHSIGVFGKNGSGIVTEMGLLDKVDILMGTFGKSFGVFGAFIYTNEKLIDFFVNRARPLIFSTALPPFVIGAIDKSLDIIISESRGERILAMAKGFRNILNNKGIDTMNSRSQIVPILAGSNSRSLGLMRYLKDNGYFAPAIRPPTVPVNLARLRLSICYFHTERDIEDLSNIIVRYQGKK